MTSCDGSVGRLVRYANEIDKLDGEELSNAQRHATDRFVSKPLFINRMKLALALTHPNAEPGQRDRGVELLRDALATDLAATSSEKAFARFLYTLLASRAEQVSPDLESTRKVNAELKNRENQLKKQLQKAQKAQKAEEALVEERRERQTLEWQLKEERRERQTLEWQLKEERRERQTLEWQLKEERRERQTLEWQLQALKQLEETIQEREGSDEESSQ